jgi:hypothetical protein
MAESATECFVTRDNRLVLDRRVPRFGHPGAPLCSRTCRFDFLKVRFVAFCCEIMARGVASVSETAQRAGEYILNKVHISKVGEDDTSIARTARRRGIQRCINHRCRYSNKC